MELDPQLVDPICEGSIVQVDFQHLADLLKTPVFVHDMFQIGPYTAFTNPPMSFARFLIPAE